MIPPIFASSIILFPRRWGNGSVRHGHGVVKDIASTLSPGQPIYVSGLCRGDRVLLLFYTALVFSFRETADNLKEEPGALCRASDRVTRLRATLIGS